MTERRQIQSKTKLTSKPRYDAAANFMQSADQALNDVFAWARQRNFAGHDPFDALNSQLFQMTPLTKFRSSRLLWTQLLKRSPLNLRRLALVPPQQNAKGIALFALAALANYRRLRTVEWENQARDLLDILIELRLTTDHGVAWGYNFDWQSKHFFAPRGTPMIVPTAFAARALVEGSSALNDPAYLELARQTCPFILEDLNRTVNSDSELCFSYSPVDQTCVFNASLLAAEILARVGKATNSSEFCSISLRAVRYVVAQQRDDGAWAYGAAPNQKWIDNFHTAYVLNSLHAIVACCSDAKEFVSALMRGYSFWRERFFLADGWPKYYDDALYPADTHSAATAIVTLLELQHLDPQAYALAQSVAEWLLNNMYAGQGRFHYQRKRFLTIRTPFMRWSQAWVAYALARLLEEKSRRD